MSRCTRSVRSRGWEHYSPGLVLQYRMMSSRKDPSGTVFYLENNYIIRLDLLALHRNICKKLEVVVFYVLKRVKTLKPTHSKGFEQVIGMKWSVQVDYSILIYLFLGMAWNNPEPVLPVWWFAARHQAAAEAHLKESQDEWGMGMERRGFAVHLIRIQRISTETTETSFNLPVSLYNSGSIWDSPKNDFITAWWILPPRGSFWIMCAQTCTECQSRSFWLRVRVVCERQPINAYGTTMGKPLMKQKQHELGCHVAQYTL